MDASWDSYNRSSNGSLVPDPTLWPSGIDHTVSYVHGLDMGFGLCTRKQRPLPTPPPALLLPHA
eukprot:COSAG04_NODE_1929_length_5198_cov_2.596195_4_plen_64_part_00